MLKPERLAAFSDGVIAIAITLLVLGLEVPSVHEVPEQELTHYLRTSFHAVAGYVSSFVLVGTYWLQHYVIFHYITRVDRTFVVLNGLFLLCVSFVPFPTGLQAVYRDDELAIVLYGVTQAVCGICLMALWTYATSKRRLVSPETSDDAVRQMWVRMAMTPVISFVAIAVSVISIDLSRLVFAAIPITYFSQKIADGPWNSKNDSASAEA
ncbi:MAG: TMEM175 family protein [Pirellulales bacterium]